MKQVKQTNLDNLIVRPIQREEESRWKELMNRHHYLGFRQMVGTYLCYIAELNGQWVALLSWSWAALKSRHREKWIGWTEELKNKRLCFVANNVRFLILPHITIKNLASKTLSLNLKRLACDWQRVHGHRLVLVETFVDDSQFQGTCYRAAGWIPLGQTRGYRKNKNKYIYHGQKKTIWVKALHRRACEMLRAPFLDRYLTQRLPEGISMDIEQLPLQGKGGLIDFLAKIHDPRKARGIRHASEALLALSISAGLCGAVSYEAIAHWGRCLSKEALRSLGFRRGLPPSESTIRRFLQQIDPVHLDAQLEKWILKKVVDGELKTVAIDGKVLRGSYDGDSKPIQLLSAIVQKQGIVVGQRAVDSKTNEIPVARELLKDLPLAGAVVTGDAIHTQSETASFLVKKKKADYVFVVKDNQPSLKDDIQSLDDEAFSPCAYRSQ